jgi:hypothetical protein
MILTFRYLAEVAVGDAKTSVVENSQQAYQVRIKILWILKRIQGPIKCLSGSGRLLNVKKRRFQLIVQQAKIGPFLSSQ